MKVFTVVLSVFTVTSCAVNEIRSEYVPQKDVGKGVIILSLTHDEGHFAYPPQCKFRNLTTKIEDTTISLSSQYVPSDKGVIYSKTVLTPMAGKPAILGRITAIELPVGEYEFFSCSSSQGAIGFTYNTTEPFSLRFTVADGVSSYLGNIRVSPGLNGNKFGITILDSRDRDFELISTLWPNIDKSAIKIEPLVFAK